MKLFELAKEFNVKSKVLMDLLNENSEKKVAPMSILTDEQVDFLRAELGILKEEKEQEEKAAEAKVILEANKPKTDKDYKPDEMIECHSIFPGILYFYGKHTGMTYTFYGAGDRRNVEYQDLKAAMLEHTDSLYNPDIVIDDMNLINDEHWWEIKRVYEDMFDEDDIKKVMSLNTKDFRTAFSRLPATARDTIISIYASQIEDGTFEQWNKTKIIDEVCGTRFDLKM